MKYFFPLMIVLFTMPIFKAYGNDELTVSYLDRPPYYFEESGKAKGFLNELAKKVFQDAQLNVTFIEMPPKRIMYYLKSSEGKHCSIGWFKNPEREKFALFSSPIYQSIPAVVLTTKTFKPKIEGYSSLREVFSDHSLVMAKVSAFSYGTNVDKLIDKFKPKTFEIVTKQYILPKLLALGRANYMLIAPEEIEVLVKSAGLNPTDFVTLQMSDMPVGNKRYIMCNKNVGETAIHQINTSIKKHAHFDRN